MMEYAFYVWLIAAMPQTIDPPIDAPNVIIKVCSAGYPLKELQRDPELWGIFQNCVTKLKERFSS